MLKYTRYTKIEGRLLCLSRKQPLQRRTSQASPKFCRKVGLSPLQGGGLPRTELEEQNTRVLPCDFSVRQRTPNECPLGVTSVHVCVVEEANKQGLSTGLQQRWAGLCPPGSGRLQPIQPHGGGEVSPSDDEAETANATLTVSEGVSDKRFLQVSPEQDI